MKYINTKTGAVLYSPFVISGEHWELAAEPARQSVGKSKEAAAKPEEVPSKPEAL